MPKYYVDSGNLKFIAVADNPKDAILTAVSKCRTNVRLGSIIRVNEQGFAKEHNDDMFIDTLVLLDELDIEGG